MVGERPTLFRYTAPMSDPEQPQTLFGRLPPWLIPFVCLAGGGSMGAGGMHISFDEPVEGECAELLGDAEERLVFIEGQHAALFETFQSLTMLLSECGTEDDDG